MISANIVGLRQMYQNLDRADKRLGKGWARGLKKGGLIIQRTSQERTPVEYGPLKASAFTRAEGIGFSTRVTVGYTSAYAAFVHELVGMVLRGKPRPSGLGSYWDPAGKGQAHFLSSAILDEKTNVQKMVRKEAYKELHDF